MPRRQSRVLTEVELEFMRLLWDHGPSTPDDIQKLLAEKGRELTGGSIRKVLSILCAKGYADREKHGKTYVYSSSIKQQQANRRMIQDMLNRVFDGSASRMVASLLDSRPITDNDLMEIESLIAEYRQSKE